MLHITLRLVLRSARGADFDDRLLFHSGVTDIILRHFWLIAYSFSFGTPRAAQEHRKYQIESSPPYVWTFILPTWRRTDVAHDVLVLCPLILRVSRWTKPPSSSRNVVMFLKCPVLSLDDQVHITT